VTEHCPWRHCECDHVFCRFGWLELEDGRTKPCPGCRPEVAKALERPLTTVRATNAEEARREWAEIDQRLHEALPALSRPSRENPNAKPAGKPRKTT
jgi:hypothetical protein